MESGSMKLTVGSWMKIAGLVLFGLWLGVPTFNKWKADKLVDELCAKDGGVKVYETVTLPKEWLNQWGDFVVPDKRVMKPEDRFYRVWESTDIKGKMNSSNIGDLAISKNHFLLYRSKDKKLMGEAIDYGRRGGDPIGPWHPSSYSSYLCPQYIDNELSKQIFLKSSN
jgi:hypothetical protein